MNASTNRVAAKIRMDIGDNISEQFMIIQNNCFEYFTPGN